eukprot:scaffold110691_cov33-Phaeocystis_antarctica.AAC.1
MCLSLQPYAPEPVAVRVRAARCCARTARPSRGCTRRARSRAACTATTGSAATRCSSAPKPKLNP